MEQEKILRPRNWLYEFLVLAQELLIFGSWRLVLGSWQLALFAGAVTYLTLAWTLRLILQRHHRKGMRQMRGKEYEEAAISFQNSYNFFTKYPWIDQYRFTTMFSSNAIPFQQMALNNLGICYLHVGEDAKALDAFRKLAELNGNYPYITKTIEEIQKHIGETAGLP